MFKGISQARIGAEWKSDHGKRLTKWCNLVIETPFRVNSLTEDLRICEKLKFIDDLLPRFMQVAIRFTKFVFIK